MALEAIVFDMDGTLVDSMPYHYKSWEIFFQQNDIHMTREDFDRVHHGTLFDIMPRIFGTISHDDSYRLGQQKESIYRELYKSHIKPMDGLLPWLETIRNSERKIGLGTAADDLNMNFTIDAIGVREYFDALVTSNTVKEGKPSPAVYLEVARRLQVLPSNCLVFEDTRSGILAAQAAGMPVVAINSALSPHELNQLKTVGAINNYQNLSIEMFEHLFH
jgi:HAD superfamily hydrolase (TIGR01509 family)